MNENSNRVMFQQGFKEGQEDMKKKILEGMPEIHSDEYCSCGIEGKECEEIGYREEIINIINKL